jgi:hypothetical protein
MNNAAPIGGCPAVRILLWLVVLTATPISFVGSLLAPRASAQTLQVSVGFGERIRAGTWVPIQISVLSEVPLANVRIQLRTIDVDGVTVEQTDLPSQAFNIAANSRQPQWRYIRVGSVTDPIQIHLIDERQQIRSQVTWIPTVDQQVAIHEPMVLFLGNDFGLIDPAQRPISGQRRATSVMVEVADPSQLPPDAVGLEMVDTIVISCDDPAFLQAISASSAQAIVQWLRSGGQVHVVGGNRWLPAAEAAPWLRELAPSFLSEGAKPTRPSPIESFAGAQEALAADPLGAVLDDREGLVRLVGRGREGQRNMPLLVERLVGLGRSYAVGLDLNDQPIGDWSARNQLLQAIFPSVLAADELPPLSNAGYRDLSGQLQLILDRFQAAPSIPFSWLAAALVLYMAIIGPLDYVIVNRWLGKPRLTWLTFPIYAMAAVAGFYWWSQQGRTTQTVQRLVSITDIDPATQTIRSLTYQQLLTPTAQSINARHRRADWIPASGAALGSWHARSQETTANRLTNNRSSKYTIDSAMTAPAVADRSPPPQLQGLPIATFGTKALEVRWLGQAPPCPSSSLSEVTSSDQLRGPLSNPLPVDLLDGLLIYRNWAYSLPKRLRVGEQIGEVQSLPQRNFRWRLSRKQMVGGGSQAAPWDATMANDVGRLLEVTLFHQASGGTSYTNLTNGPLRGWDLSHVLQHPRAILFGRVATPPLQWAPDGDAAWSDELSYSAVRIVLPVVIDQTTKQPVSPDVDLKDLNALEKQLVDPSPKSP